MNSPPHEWLSLKFGTYYSTCLVKPSIREISKREFGFGGWEKKIEFRHMQFPNEAEFVKQLVQDRPLYVSCSAAYYEMPAARPMQKKNWLGADLIFDLDAEAHSCAPFTCEECFAKIKMQTQRLIEEFLMPDFGLSEKDVQINFSGSRGYHVRVFKEEFFPLGREERREIVDYIQGTGLEYSSLFHEEDRSITIGERASHFKMLSGPTPTQGGYRGKFAREAAKIISVPEKAGAISPKLRHPENAQKFLKGMEEGDWSRVPITKRDEKFRGIFESLRVRLSDQVDANVTCDTSKILRVPDSIHGGSGMLAKTIKLSQLEKFDPTADALAFPSSKMEKVRFLQAIPSIAWNGETTNEHRAGAAMELPEGLAVYLVAKKAAEPA